MNIAYYFAYYGGLVLKSRSQAKIDNRSIQGYQPCVCLGYSPSQWCNFSFVIQMLKIDRDPPPVPPLFVDSGASIPRSTFTRYSYGSSSGKSIVETRSYQIDPRFHFRALEIAC